MSQVRRPEVNRAAFERAKHFKWTITEPGGTPGMNLPGRIYDSAVLQVGGYVVLMGLHQPIWQELRVLFYNVRDHSWKVVNRNGPKNSSKFVLGLVEDKIYLMGALSSRIFCFDIVLRDWAPLGFDGIAARSVSCLRCFMENIQSFVCWEKSEGPVLSVLDLRHQTWSEHHAKGEVPSDIMGSSLASCYGSSIYVLWGDVHESPKTILYILSLCNNRYHWSKPKLIGLCPSYSSGGSLTYHSGRLFRIGGYARGRLFWIYSIEENMWHEASQSADAEYSVHGPMLHAAGHSAIALNDKIVVFGGLSLMFKSCRFLQARYLD